MLQAREFSAAISVDGVALTPFDIRRFDDDRKVYAFIPSEDQKPFTISVNDSSHQFAGCVNLYVDGVFLNSWFVNHFSGISISSAFLETGKERPLYFTARQDAESSSSQTQFEGIIELRILKAFYDPPSEPDLSSQVNLLQRTVEPCSCTYVYWPRLPDRVFPEQPHLLDCSFLPGRHRIRLGDEFGPLNTVRPIHCFVPETSAYVRFVFNYGPLELLRKTSIVASSIDEDPEDRVDAWRRDVLDQHRGKRRRFE